MDFFKGLSDRYNDIWKNIISPQRQLYFLNDLGQKVQIIRKVPVVRYDLDIKNARGQTLKCTFYSPEKCDKTKIGCVIYLHGNASSRVEALTTYNYLLPRTTLFCFDFAGSGKSEGDYVTLGVNEAEDVALIVEYIKKNIGIQKIAIWGRSMGAATAINYCANNPKQVVALALDSGFIKLSKILEEIGKEKTNIPNFLVDTVLLFIKNKINSVLNMDIFQLDLIEQIKKIKNFGGIIFASAEKDSIINSYHTQKLYDSYSGEKQLVKFDGDHNTLRPPYFFKAIAQFLEKRLYGQELQQLPTLAEDEQFVLQKEISLNNDDQFIKAMKSIPNTLDKTDQLVEQCIKQLESIACPLQFNDSKNQDQQTRKSSGSSSSDQQQAEYYLAQKYLASNNQNNIQIKDKIVTTNSFNNSKKIKQLCTNLNNQGDFGGMQQQNTNNQTISPLQGQYQKRNSQTQREEHVYPQTQGNSPFQRYQQYQKKQETSPFQRKSNGIISQDTSQDIYQYNKGQVNNTSYDEVIDHRKEDLLKRVFEEIEFNPRTASPTHYKNSTPTELNMSKSASTKIIQNQHYLNKRNQDELSKSPTRKISDTIQEQKSSPTQRINEEEQIYMYTDFSSKIRKEPGRQFPQKLLKTTLLNDNIGDTSQINEGKIKVAFHNVEQQKIQNTQNNYNDQSKLFASSPIQQNFQFNQMRLTTKDIQKTNRESFSDLLNTHNGERMLFGSLIESVNNNSSSPFSKNNGAENNMHIYKSQSFRENLYIEETEYVEDNLVTKETPKQFANIRTLQEIRGVDNRNEKAIPMSQNEQHIQNLINKYKMEDFSQSPSNFNQQQLLKEEEKQNEVLNKIQTFGNLNDKQLQKLQSSNNNQPVKQIQVTLQDQIQKFKVQQTNLPEVSPYKNYFQQQIDNNSYRNANFEQQNAQLAQFYNDNSPQQIKIIGSNPQIEHVRNNNHKEYQYYDKQGQNTIIGNRIHLSSIDKNSKIPQNIGNQFSVLNEPQISAIKPKIIENYTKPEQNNISAYLHQQIVHNKQNIHNHHHIQSVGQIGNPLNHVKVLQKFQNEQNHQSPSNRNLINNHQPLEHQNSLNNNNFIQQNYNSVPQKGTDVKGVSLLQNQQIQPNKIQLSSMNSYQPNILPLQNDTNMTQKYNPQDMNQQKQNDTSLKGEVQGIQMLASTQNIQDVYKPLTSINNQVNKSMMNSRNQSPIVNQSSNYHYQFQPSQPNQLFQKQLSNNYIQQNPIHQINVQNIGKNENILHSSILSKSTNNSVNPYSYVTNKQMNMSQNLIQKVEQQQRAVDKPQDQVKIVGNNINYSVITPSTITQQSSHIKKDIDSSQINRQIMPNINNIQTNFIYQNIDNNQYQNQIAQLNKSPKNQTKFNLKLDQVGNMQNYDVPNQGSGTDRCQNNYVV